MADETDIDTDDLHGDVRAAMAELNGESPPEREPVAESPPESEPQRERDEAGRFKAKDTERPTLSLKEKPGAPVAPPVVGADASSPSAATPPAPDATKPEPIAPPLEWKGAGKVKWDRLPREVQTELRDTWQAMATERADLAPLKELFDTNREFLVNQAGSLNNAMTQLMQFARMSVDNPVGLIQHIARTTGTDLRSLVGQPEQGAPQGQPTPPADIAQLVRQELQPILGQFEQQRTQQIHSEIQAFRSDPAHPYFNDVAPMIELLLKGGAATGLQDAYDKAVKLDPTIQAHLEAERREEAKKAQAAEVDKANKARAASLRGSPISGAAPKGAGDMNSSVHDDVRAAMAELAGA